MSAPTPGQAAYEAWFGNDGADWNGRLNTFAQAAWENIAQRAIDAFLAGDSVSAETIREALAAREPQPAPELAALQLITAVDALRDIRDSEHPYGSFARDVARKGLDDIGAPPPAPELADVLADRHEVSGLNAWQGAEIGRLREQLAKAHAEIGELARAVVATADRDDLARQCDSLRSRLHAVLGKFTSNGAGYTARMSGVVLARQYTDAGMPLRDDLSHLAGQ